MDNNDFPYRAYAMEYGTFLGIAWTVVFFIYIAGFCTGNTIYFLLGLMGFLSLAVLPFMLAWRIGGMQEKGESLGMVRGIFFTFNMFMFACLFSCACEFAYFSFMDNGTLLESFRGMVLTPEIKISYQQMGMSDTYTQIGNTINELEKLSALEKTEMMFNSNIFVSMLFLFPVSFIASRKNN